jgi:hypothetical protein
MNFTVVGHAWTRASFGQRREKTTPTMKDYELSSEEILIKYCSLPEEILTTSTNCSHLGCLLTSLVELQSTQHSNGSPLEPVAKSNLHIGDLYEDTTGSGS